MLTIPALSLPKATRNVMMAMKSVSMTALMMLQFLIEDDKVGGC